MKYHSSTRGKTRNLPGYQKHSSAYPYLARWIRSQDPFLPIIVESSESHNADAVGDFNGIFIDKMLVECLCREYHRLFKQELVYMRQYRRVKTHRILHKQYRLHCSTSWWLCPVAICRKLSTVRPSLRRVIRLFLSLSLHLFQKRCRADS